MAAGTGPLPEAPNFGVFGGNHCVDDCFRAWGAAGRKAAAAATGTPPSRPSFEGHRLPPVRGGPIWGVGRSDQDVGSHDGRNPSPQA